MSNKRTVLFGDDGEITLGDEASQGVLRKALVTAERTGHGRKIINRAFEDSFAPQQAQKRKLH